MREILPQPLRGWKLFSGVSQGSPADGATFICSFSWLISLLCCVLSGICRLEGCGTKASVASRVEQPSKRRVMLPPAFRSISGHALHLHAALSLPFCFPCSGKVLRPVPPRKGHRRCARARSTFGRPLACPQPSVSRARPVLQTRTVA